MADNKDKPACEDHSVELNDLTEEVSKEQLEDVKGGDFHMSTRVIVKKVPIRP